MPSLVSGDSLNSRAPYARRLGITHTLVRGCLELARGMAYLFPHRLPLFHLGNAPLSNGVSKDHSLEVLPLPEGGAQLWDAFRLMGFNEDIVAAFRQADSNLYLTTSKCSEHLKYKVLHTRRSPWSKGLFLGERDYIRFSLSFSS